MNCKTHKDHNHTHSESCGHLRIVHNDHIDYVHDGHLHRPHDGHYDECKIEVSSANPVGCHPVKCELDHESLGHEKIPHGDHTDYLFEGRLHCPHGDHCDDHGEIKLAK